MKPRLIPWLLLAALAAPAWAQSGARKRSQPPPQNLPRTSIVQNVNEVNVVFSAIDSRHRIVLGLKPTQIEVFDDNKPQAITRFYAEGNLPLRIALLLDTSTSISDRWPFEQEAAIEFIESVLRQGTDKAMVVAFDSSIQVVQGFTSNEEAIARAIHSLRPGGGTALYDAIYETCHEKLMRDGHDMRNVIVLITDGDDDQSRYAATEALRMAQRAGAIMYTIGTDPTGSDPRDDKLLAMFAKDTGGRYFFPFQAPDLGKAFASISYELRHQYVVAYDPNDFVPNGAFHRVKIRILLKNIYARTQPG
ncbi:MAG: VWA domain-containing protein, partial [Terriglobales bacterium]